MRNPTRSRADDAVRCGLLWLAASALCDIAISSVLVGRLTMHRRSIVRNVGSGEFTSEVHERTFSWTRTLVQTSLATAGATTIVQTAALVLLAIDPCVSVTRVPLTRTAMTGTALGR